MKRGEREIERVNGESLLRKLQYIVYKRQKKNDEEEEGLGCWVDNRSWKTYKLKAHDAFRGKSDREIERGRE